MAACKAHQLFGHLHRLLGLLWGRALALPVEVGVPNLAPCHLPQLVQALAAPQQLLQILQHCPPPLTQAASQACMLALGRCVCRMASATEREAHGLASRSQCTFYDGHDCGDMERIAAIWHEQSMWPYSSPCCT